jgi:hypothetical protein
VQEPPVADACEVAQDVLDRAGVGHRADRVHVVVVLAEDHDGDGIRRGLEAGERREGQKSGNLARVHQRLGFFTAPALWALQRGDVCHVVRLAGGSGRSPQHGNGDGRGGFGQHDGDAARA